MHTAAALARALVRAVACGRCACEAWGGFLPSPEQGYTIIYIAVVTYASPMVTCVIYRQSQQSRVELTTAMLRSKGRGGAVAWCGVVARGSTAARLLLLALRE